MLVIGNPGYSPQNIYDDLPFFNGYRALRLQDSGLNGAIEEPALRALLPPLEGLRIIDLGCGFGHFARFARSRGAQEVVGIDISERMLQVAREFTTDPGIRYIHDSIEGWTGLPASVDLVVSSLALHYVADFSAVAHHVASALVPGGLFVLSVEHPLCTAHPVGWRTEDGQTFWPVDRYAEEGLRRTQWFVENVIKYHRRVATYLTALITAGLTIVAIDEPTPTPEAIAARPLLENERRRPPFLLIAAEKQGNASKSAA